MIKIDIYTVTGGFIQQGEVQASTVAFTTEAEARRWVEYLLEDMQENYGEIKNKSSFKQWIWRFKEEGAFLKLEKMTKINF